MIEFSFHGFDERFDHPALRDCWLQSHKRAERLRESPGSESMRCAACDTLQPLPKAEDWREGMACKRCGLTARLRSSVAFLKQLCPREGRMYATEQATTLYARLQQEWPHVQGSEFASDPAQRKKLMRHLRGLGGHGDIVFQDVTRLTWGDASFDAVFSGDVLEHVPDYRAALREFSRVLRPGGALVATFPFTDGESTVVRARLNEVGEVEHLLPAEYHGDPLGGGVLCFYHFGWDILDAVRAAGFNHAQMVMPWAPEEGVYFGNWTLVAQR